MDGLIGMGGMRGSVVSRLGAGGVGYFEVGRVGAKREMVVAIEGRERECMGSGGRRDGGGRGGSCRPGSESGLGKGVGGRVRYRLQGVRRGLGRWSEGSRGLTGSELGGGRVVRGVVM